MANDKELTVCRVPNPSPSLSIWIFLVLLYWTRHLYVFLPSHVSGEMLTKLRCAVYIFTGSILLDIHVTNQVFGTIIAIIGVAYVVLEFVPSIEPPQNMREADGGWGAEQV